MMAPPSPSAATATAPQQNDAAGTTPTEPEVSFRMEHDLIGDEKVPKDAYYGIQTQRA